MDWLDAITVILALLVALLALRHPLHKPSARHDHGRGGADKPHTPPDEAA